MCGGKEGLRVWLSRFFSLWEGRKVDLMGMEEVCYSEVIIGKKVGFKALEKEMAAGVGEEGIDKHCRSK